MLVGKYCRQMKTKQLHTVEKYFGTIFLINNWPSAAKVQNKSPTQIKQNCESELIKGISGKEQKVPHIIIHWGDAN